MMDGWIDWLSASLPSVIEWISYTPSRTHTCPYRHIHTDRLSSIQIHLTRSILLLLLLSSSCSSSPSVASSLSPTPSPSRSINRLTSPTSWERHQVQIRSNCVWVKPIQSTLIIYRHTNKLPHCQKQYQNNNQEKQKINHLSYRVIYSTSQLFQSIG